MKKHLTFLVVMLLGMTSLNARPVDVAQAKQIAQQFVSANFNNIQENSALELVYTGVSTRGEACFYTFNKGESGFVIVSADDRFRPIVGYSDEGPFATENPSPELMFYLDKIIEARTSRNAVSIDRTAEEWQSVATTGKLLSRNGGRGVDYICTTKWNQDSPYNLYAPEASGGSGGRCYAGCVATAMSQVMKRWNHPLQGTGSHSYYCYGYGNQSANFGATTYQWDLMPDRLAGASQEEIEAVALFMYHCGVSVDMNFSPSGSGANSWDVPYAIRHYFSYTNQCSLKSRDEYSLTNWQNMLKDQFDIGWPVYYSGFSNDGGHAFVCDGYDDNDLFHFNWGWGGSSDGWFVIDEIDYAGWAQAIFNYVPTDVYDYMPMQPENFEVNSHGDFDYSATLTWTNPTQNIHLEDLTNIDQIVVTRDGEIIYTEDNVAPGANMTFTDHYLPTMVKYAVYAVVHNAKGIEAIDEQVILGPSCVWHIDMVSDNDEGWKGGHLTLVNSAGVEICQLTTLTASTSTDFVMPMGHVDIIWNSPTQAIEKVQFEIKDGNDNTVLDYEGASSDLSKGLFFIANNHCGSDANHNAPMNLIAVRSGNDVNLTWDAPNEGQVDHYYVYRDRLLFAVAEGTNFTDTNVSDALHNYHVTAVNEQGESDPSNFCSVYQENGLCETPTNLRFEMTTNTKVKLMWDEPQDESITGYILYRRVKGQEFKRIKLLTKTFHTDNIGTQEDQRFEYAVTAYYNANDCESGYAPTESNPELHFVEVNKTIIPQYLDFQIHQGNVFLTWQQATLAEGYNIYRNGERIAQGVTETYFFDYEASMQQTYRYTVTGCTASLESSPSNEVYVDWTTDVNENTDYQEVSVYPNPTEDKVYIEANGLRQVKVFNLTGQEILNQTVSVGQATLDLSAQPQGCYFIETVTDQGCKTTKILKTK